MLDRENRQREYYINRVYPILLDKGERVSAVRGDTGGMIGANSRAELAALERLLRGRINRELMNSGVTLVDPDTTYVDAGVRVGAETVLHPLTFLSGETTVGRRCEIGPSSRLVDTRVADDASVTFTVAEGARIGRGADVGPFARLRPGTVLAGGVHVGSYVEIKSSHDRRGHEGAAPVLRGRRRRGPANEPGRGHRHGELRRIRQAPHRDRGRCADRLGYDAGGAGEGRQGAVTGAGSVITKDVPAGSLAVERSEQRTVKGYRKRKDAEHRGSLKGGTVEIITKKRMMLFSGTIHPALGHEIADNLGIPVSEAKLSRFASGEIYFRSEESVRGADVFVVQTHYEPVNEAIMEQLIMIDAMKRASAKRITAVIPYYGYSRQDHKGLSREPISAKLVADLIATAGADRIVSIDLHSGQIQGYFDFPFDHLTALPILSNYLKDEMGLHGERPRGGGARRRPDQDRGEAAAVPARGPRVHVQAPQPHGGAQDRGDGGGRRGRRPPVRPRRRHDRHRQHGREGRRGARVDGRRPDLRGRHPRGAVGQGAAVAGGGADRAGRRDEHRADPRGAPLRQAEGAVAARR